MEKSEVNLWANCDWDPSYLSCIFDVDFDDCSDLWISDVSDSDLLGIVTIMESYCPIVEDISMDDNELCQAVEKIEEE